MCTLSSTGHLGHYPWLCVLCEHKTVDSDL
uniref:Uncharacterized protein n=1 Tax=Anguilla anguilla TaxID=7936 RepID=A0A0E9QEU3_ANGAN